MKKEHSNSMSDARPNSVGRSARIAWLSAVLLVGCSSPTETSRQSVGKITDADVVPTSFNESLKMTVKCERAVVVIRGSLPAVTVGDDAEVITMSDGTKWITWESATSQWPVEGR